MTFCRIINKKATTYSILEMLVVVPLILHVSARGLVIFLVTLLVFFLKVIKPLSNQTSLLSNQNARPQKVTPPRAKRRHKHMWVCHARTHVDCINSNDALAICISIFNYALHALHAATMQAQYLNESETERGGERERGESICINISTKRAYA
jgi:hypothetical protein